MRMRELWEYITKTPGNTNFTIFKQMVSQYIATLDNELARYTVDADVADSVDLFGKKTSDLQENVWIDDGKVYGKLKYVSGYTGFSGDPKEQEGYYLVLHFELEGADAIKVNNITLDEDGIQIIIIKNKSGRVKVEIIDGNDSFIEYLDLSGLEYE